LDDDTIRRLKTVLAFGGKDLNEQGKQKINNKNKHKT